VRPDEGAGLEAILAWAMAEHAGRLAFATSLGAEDQVILDAAVRLHRGARLALPRIFVLDTGRLHEETHDLLAATQVRYGVDIEIYFPEAALVEELVRERGPNGFRASIDARRACCDVRKVRQLDRALAGAEAWITGLRREQSEGRGRVRVYQNDALHGNILKLAPLAGWTWGDVLARAAANDVPISPLHARGFPSIGCAPCTRAIAPGEDLRAGRFWWEAEGHKECGIHE
jgi:phosphoadenosine phosphosulfate reductase